MRSNRTLRALVVLLAISLFLGMIPQEMHVQGAPPSFTKVNVTPRQGRPDIEYLFTATYRDTDNDPPSIIKVYIDSIGYEMQEVDPEDTNYTDGKDYSFKKVMSEGTYTFYYTADDGNSDVVSTEAFTLEVTWDAGHYDIIHYLETQVYPGVMLILVLFVAMIIILLVVSVAVVLQLRKIGKVLEGKGEKTGAPEEPDNRP